LLEINCEISAVLPRSGGKARMIGDRPELQSPVRRIRTYKPGSPKVLLRWGSEKRSLLPVSIRAKDLKMKPPTRGNCGALP
jgi:hypothetical protein